MPGADSSPVSPDRAFALVVGIEEYEVSHRWDLPGAARDALRFAGWLTGPAGVPPANVRLFLSPLASTPVDWGAAPPLAALEATHRPAVRENIEKALYQDLHSCDGDLLWIFWAGHGFLDAHRQMLLPYADATGEHLVHLNLESALRWWKSDNVRPTRFRLQAALVDACRVEAPRGIGTAEPGMGGAVPGRNQFTLYASREGEEAKNQAERGAGQFTDVLLQQLGAKTLDEGVQGLVEIARAMQDRFRELEEQNLGWQMPTFVRDRDWDGSSILVDDRFGIPRAPRIDQAAWDGLGELFSGRTLPDRAYDAYRYAFETAGCDVPTPFLPAAGLTEIVRDLDERQGRRTDLPLAVPFVRHLADGARQADPTWAAELEAWVASTGERLGVGAFPPPPATTGHTGLHVRLEEAGALEGGYRVTMWLHSGGFTNLWEPESPLDLDAVRLGLADQLVALSGGDGIPGGAPGRPPFRGVDRIEFDVPLELIDTDFESWKLPIGRMGKRRELGRLYEVVVRCPAERMGVSHGAWIQKWRWFMAQGGRHPEAVRALTDADVTEDLGYTLQGDDPPVCVLAEVSDPRLMDALDGVLDAGVPIAVWRRGGPPAPGGADGGLTQALTEECEVDVGRLPETLKRMRSTAPPIEEQPSWRHPLALLWDDPDCRPGSQSLS
ncbi:caspase family protein [Streptomyces sp. NRRL S-87]|uniref:VMAP-C domain-containing protein n=1 Tax=Streptomyces sp. NRRL S-87 TaxID=1463920 RepID=UPI001F1959D0|nr:caspase family protein [Streptomyces sp. NRRL S-87]